MDTILVEVLEKIFSNLKGTEVAACRRVCRRWRDVIDSFTDETWSHSDFLNPEMAKKMSNLSYQELYKSLSLWDKVEEAVTVKKWEYCFDSHIEGFKVLSGNKFAVVDYDTPDHTKPYYMCSDTIEYFSGTTLEKISEKKFLFSFSEYNESDKIILLTEYLNLQDQDVINDNDNQDMANEQIRLHIVLKNYPYMAEFCYDLLEAYEKCSFLSDSEVCFVNKSKIVCIARLKVFDGKETIETEELAPLTLRDPGEWVQEFVRVGHNTVNILTCRFVQTHADCVIYTACDQNFSHRCEIKLTMSTPDIIRNLKEYGFYWANREIYQSVFSPINKVQFHNHHVVLTQTYDQRHAANIQNEYYSSMIHIFKRPYNDSDTDMDLHLLTANGEIKFNNCKPNKNIDFGPMSIVEHIDVVEILSGHRLFVTTTLGCTRAKELYIIDLEHKECKESESNAGDDGDQPRPNTSSEDRESRDEIVPIDISSVLSALRSLMEDI